MRHAPDGVDFPRAWVDELRPCLMDSVTVFPKLFLLHLARVTGWGPNLLRAPFAATNVVPDVLLRDLRVRCPWSPRGIRKDVRRNYFRSRSGG